MNAAKLALSIQRPPLDAEGVEATVDQIVRQARLERDTDELDEAREDGFAAYQAAGVQADTLAAFGEEAAASSPADAETSRRAFGPGG